MIIFNWLKEQKMGFRNLLEKSIVGQFKVMATLQGTNNTVMLIDTDNLQWALIPLNQISFKTIHGYCDDSQEDIIKSTGYDIHVLHITDCVGQSCEVSHGGYPVLCKLFIKKPRCRPLASFKRK